MKYPRIISIVMCWQIFTVLARVFDFKLADLMCEHYKTNQLHLPASPLTFMVKGVIPTNGLEMIVFVGVIISENSILTRFDFDSGQASMHLDQLGSVVVKTFHDNENDYHAVGKFYQLAETNFVLVKLKYGLKFDSNLYPLCLWHNAEQPTSLTEVPVFYAYVSDHNYTIMQPGRFTGKILSNGECGISSENETQFCFEFGASDSQIREEILIRDWFVSSGIIIFEYNSTNYLWGLYLESFETESDVKYIGHRVSAVYDAIEKYVWLSFTKSLQICGLRYLERDVLYGAYNASKGEFPWHVAIYETEPRKKYICGGTIIDERTILTAAHCIYDEYGSKKPQNLQIVLGICSLKERKLASQKFTAHRLIQYPTYTINISANDIGIIQLNRSIEFNNYVQPICLTNDSSIFPLDYGTVVGWGQVKKAKFTNNLHRGDFKIRTDSNCIEVTSTDSVHIIDEYNFCAGYLNGTNVCIGDSGGGLVVPKYGIWYLYGIVSFFHKNSRETCAASKISIFTDATKFYNWIQSFMYANRKSTEKSFKNLTNNISRFGRRFGLNKLL